MKKAICKNCDFTEEYEPDEFGMNYFQAIGECPNCGSELVDENGEPTQQTIEFKLT